MATGFIRQLGTNSAIYAATNLLQKGTAFLLMPLYTLYLDPSAYGILAVVTSINGLLGIAFTLSLTSAVTRFYFEHVDDPHTLAEFWGSILSFVMLLSTVLAGTLLMIGERLLAPMTGDIPFWPYVAIGVLTTLFQPFFSTFLTVLQTRNQALRFSVVSLAQFGLTTSLTIALVVFLGWGVSGALTATLVASAVFFPISWWMLRRDLRICLKWQHLRSALAYSLPQLPHSIAGQASAITDRLVLNARLGTAAAGLYSVGAMIAMVVEVAAQSINRAYVPIGMEALRRRSAPDLAQLRAIGALIVGTFCLLGVTIAAFSREILWLLAAPAFAGAVVVIPVLLFVGVASSIYYLFVNVLFFDRSATKLIPLGTLTAAGMNILLVLVLVPSFGLVGAAWATLCAQCVATVLIALIGSRFDPVRWQYTRYAIAFTVSLACALWAGRQDHDSLALSLLLKVGCVAIVAVLLGTLFWSRPLIFAQTIWCLLSGRFSEAAALFADAENAA